MKRTALGLALALSVGASACALHPVVAEPGYDPYYGSGGEQAAYEAQQHAAWQQQRAYEHAARQQHAYDRAAAREQYERQRAYEHQRREQDRWANERAMHAAHAEHERAAWEQQAQRQREVAHVTGHGAYQRPEPRTVYPAPGARVAPAAPPAARGRIAPR